jgi:hypothetical protein
MRRLLLCLFAVLGCTDSIPLKTGTPCPCSPGFVCCAQTSTCLAAADCPSGTTSDPDAGAGTGGTAVTVPGTGGRADGGGTIGGAGGVAGAGGAIGGTGGRVGAGGAGGAVGGTGGRGGAGGNEDTSCGLTASQLATAFEVPAGPWNTAGATGSACPTEQPIQGDNYYMAAPVVPEAPCGRTPTLTMQPRLVPVRPAGEQVPYRLVLTNRNEPDCPAQAWSFEAVSLNRDVALVGAGQETKVLSSGGQYVICLRATTQPPVFTGSSSRIDFAFGNGQRVRDGAFWHPTRDPGCTQDPVLSQPIACPKFPTAGNMEKDFIIPRCGKPGDATCHATGPFPPKMAELGLGLRMLNMKSVLKCASSKYIDSLNPADSFLLAKVKAASDAEVRCPVQGGTGGPREPYSQPMLAPDEIACLESYVFAIAGR